MPTWITLSFFAVFALSACQSMPDHEVVRLKVQGGSVSAEAGRISKPEEIYPKPVSQLNNYLCRSPRDEQKVVEWMYRNCRGPKE